MGAHRKTSAGVRAGTERPGAGTKPRRGAKARAGQAAAPRKGPGRPPGHSAGSRRGKLKAVTAAAGEGMGALLGEFSAGDAAGAFRAIIRAEGARVSKEGLTSAQRGLILQRLSTAIVRLGEVTGETLEIGPEKILKLPSFRRVLDRLVEALKPYPEAGQAVVAAMRGGA